MVNGIENKYQTFQGQELEEDLGKNTLAYQWRDYDPAIARFNKIDRFAEKYQNLSPYSFTGNNPIKYKEINGDSISGVAKKDARRARKIMRQNFKGSKNRKIRRLFKTKGNSFKTISKEKLAKATEGVDSKTKALASAYAQAINSDYDHKVEVVKKGDELSKFSQTKTALGIMGINDADDVEARSGGGVNAPLLKDGNLTIIVMNSDLVTPLVNPSDNSITPMINIPSTLSHELLGHGVSRVLNSPTAGHIDAIQMENLSLRVQGITLQNNGKPHKKSAPALSQNTYSGIPTHFQ